MHRQQGAPPRAKSAFAAAFLSLIFPGLGQAYLGAWYRALGFAAGPVLIFALTGGFLLRMDRQELVTLVVNPTVLTSVFVLNIIASGGSPTRTIAPVKLTPLRNLRLLSCILYLPARRSDCTSESVACATLSPGSSPRKNSGDRTSAITSSLK